MTQTAIVQMLVSGRDDLSWFDSNLTSLKSRYNNKFIAFHNKSVIDADEVLENLVERLKKNGIDTSNVFVKFISTIKEIL